MSFRADQLEGDAQKVIREDVAKMSELGRTGDKEGNEVAAVELM